MNDDASWHEPVLIEEALALLKPRSTGLYLDGTLGGGGHAEAVLEASAPDGRLIGLDRDPEAVRHAAERLAGFGDRIEIHCANYADVDEVLPPETRLDGALLDLGVSSRQIDEMARGFSYQRDAPLDMRMGPRGEPGRDWLSRAEYSDLVEVLRDYGEERHARSIARAIVREREREPIETTGRLREIVESAVPKSAHPLKSVARVFQAIRIHVNDELGALDRGLEAIKDRLGVGARLVVISYHSLEDRIVKRTFRAWATECVCPPDLPICGCDEEVEATVVTSKPIGAPPEEIERNPRARSARMRAAERRRAA
ncbi:MAG: 16S rRNA (cytosine(1402)-N(4))-methyltransferase RsmH [Gemmatimonadota bacterium]|nr:16S rRNA (cytosine(1402)-N(4))-methyltransferase RsmH [Gemmatimonadota bacterium]